MEDYFKKLLFDVFRGDMQALNFMELLFDVAHFWDDLVDRDKPVSSDRINLAMINIMVNLPRNAFYQKHFAILSPIIENSISNWLIANVLESTNKLEAYRIAFIARSSYIDVAVACSRIIGGGIWSIQAGVKLREFIHSEGFLEYLRALGEEHSANREQ